MNADAHWRQVYRFGTLEVVHDLADELGTLFVEDVGAHAFEVDAPLFSGREYLDAIRTAHFEG
jgi:hypothetical protein